MFDPIEEARKTLMNIRHQLEAETIRPDNDFFQMLDALQQVFTVAEKVNRKDQVQDAEKITEIGEQGLRLVDNLVYILVEHNLETHRHDTQQVAVLIARWVIEHGGQLTSIQSVVDGLAYLANALRDRDSLVQLASLMTQVAFACSPLIKHDLDNSNPARPWRTFNMNRGIVATRSHDLELMDAVFTDLIVAIPMDAPAFFKQGMSEMLRLNYPDPVHGVMQKFYQRTTLPARH